MSIEQINRPVTDPLPGIDREIALGLIRRVEAVAMQPDTPRAVQLELAAQLRRLARENPAMHTTFYRAARRIRGY